MHLTIAMAGLAEAAFLYALLITSAVLLATGALLAFAWWKCSPLAAAIGCFLLLIVGLVLQPWAAFAPATSTDPDATYWLARFRFAAVVWALLFTASAACLTRVMRRRTLQIQSANKDARL
jgi:hypothetical protein